MSNFGITEMIYLYEKNFLDNVSSSLRRDVEITLQIALKYVSSFPWDFCILSHTHNMYILLFFYIVVIG